jgi:hypothetical protein
MKTNKQYLAYHCHSIVSSFTVPFPILPAFSSVGVPAADSGRESAPSVALFNMKLK